MTLASYLQGVKKAMLQVVHAVKEVLDDEVMTEAIIGLKKQAKG